MPQGKHLIHKNGGARVFDFAEASDDSMVDCASSLHDHVQIFNSRIVNCVIKGRAIVANADLEDCLVEGNVVITGGKAFNCQFYDRAMMTEDTSARHSSLHGLSRLFGKARILGSALRDASVYGDAEVYGHAGHILALDGLYRVGTGTWDANGKGLPRFHRFEQLEISLTESTDGCAYVGCRRMKMSDWIFRGDRIGKHFGWPQEFIDRGKEIFREWLLVPATVVDQ